MSEVIHSSEKQTILIVDDSPENIKILNQILKNDYLISVAASGEDAISHILSNQTTKRPDIILLDIMMPHIDGYEVCRQLKKNQTVSDIPIIFVTSKDDIEDEELGFKMGAVDYITKPVSPSIVKARVKTHLLIKKQHDLLLNSISILHHKAEILQHKAEIGMLAAGLAHDINNILYGSMMIENINDLIPNNIKEKNTINEYIKTAVESLRMGREICRDFTNYLKNIGEEDSVQLFPPLLKPLYMLQNTFKTKLLVEIQPDLPRIKCRSSQIKRVIINLFINACQAVEGQKNGYIKIKVWAEKKKIFFSINDNGHGIADNILPYIFEEHYTTRKDGSGLGLSMVQKIIDSHNGTIECFSAINQGTIFIFSLPVFEDML